MARRSDHGIAPWTYNVCAAALREARDNNRSMARIYRDSPGLRLRFTCFADEATRAIKAIRALRADRRKRR